MVAKTAHVREEVVINKAATERVETVRDTVRREDVEITRDGQRTTQTGATATAHPEDRAARLAAPTNTAGTDAVPAVRGEHMALSTFNEPPYRGGAAAVETTTRVEGGRHIHLRISWAAIFGGVILVVAVQLLLGLLGLGIGLGTVNTNAGTTPGADNFGVGAGLWWVISSVIALGFGGYAAAWLAGIEIKWDGILHGLITWGIATLLTIYLLTSAIGSIIGGGFSAVGSVASAAGSGVKEAAQPLAQAAGVSPDMLQQQAQAYLQPTNPDPATMSPQDAQKQVATNLATYAKGGPDAPAAKEQSHQHHGGAAAHQPRRRSQAVRRCPG